MQAGKLRHRIRIQQKTEARSTTGQVTNAGWALVAKRWGSITPLRGREFMEAQQISSDVTHRVRMRYYRGLTSDHRLKVILDGTDRTFHISQVLNRDERDREHEIMAKEAV